MTPRRITPTEQPEFPCWLYQPGPPPFAWRRYIAAAHDFGLKTHWLPDQPTAPIVVPEEAPQRTDTPRTDAVWLSVTAKTWQVSFEAMHDHAELLERELARAKEEIEVLRSYGNKDCTAMADEALRERREQSTLNPS